MIVYESELKHYGVKGMKWGQRRALARSAKYAKKIKRGSLHAVSGLAFENSGYKKLANRYYKKADKQEQKWAAKKQKADDMAKSYNTPEAKAARKAKTKKAAKIGAAAADTALATCGIYKLGQYMQAKKDQLSAAKEATQQRLSKTANDYGINTRKYNSTGHPEKKGWSRHPDGRIMTRANTPRQVRNDLRIVKRQAQREQSLEKRQRAVEQRRQRRNR